MGVSAGLYMHDVVVKKFTFAIASPDEFLSLSGNIVSNIRASLSSVNVNKLVCLKSKWLSNK